MTERETPKGRWLRIWARLNPELTSKEFDKSVDRLVIGAILPALFVAFVAYSSLSTATRTGERSALLVAVACAITALTELGAGVYLAASTLQGQKWDAMQIAALCIRRLGRTLSFAALAVYFGNRASAYFEWAGTAAFGILVVLDIGLVGLALYVWRKKQQCDER